MGKGRRIGLPDGQVGGWAVEKEGVILNVVGCHARLGVGGTREGWSPADQMSRAHVVFYGSCVSSKKPNYPAAVAISNHLGQLLGRVNRSTE